MVGITHRALNEPEDRFLLISRPSRKGSRSCPMFVLLVDNIRLSATPFSASLVSGERGLQGLAGQVSLRTTFQSQGGREEVSCRLPPDHSILPDDA